MRVCIKQLAKIATLLSLILIISSNACAQYSLGGMPLTLKDKYESLADLNEIEKKNLPAVNVDSVKQAEKELQNFSYTPVPPRFGISVEVSYNLKNSGNWKVLPDGGRVWRLTVNHVRFDFSPGHWGG